MRDLSNSQSKKISATTLWEWYAIMIRIRMVEQTISREYVLGEMRTPVHLCVGQEAIPAVICSRLSVTDLVFSSHRSHGHYLAKGGSMVSMIAEIYGSEQGCAKGWGGSQHLIDESVGFMGSVPILGASLAIATGAAYWLKATGTSSIVVSFFGDAAVEEGVFHESLNFAALRRLPILYVCENNLYSTHAHIAIRQPDRPLTRLGAAHGVLSLECDGNDYQDIYSTFTRAHREIASTKGPAFIVANTYRHLEHVGPGDDLHLGYRKKEELDFHLAKDPIARIRRDLKGSFADFETREGMLLKQIRSEIEENLVAAKLQVNVATR